MPAITQQPAALEAALQQAILHHRAGRLTEAERIYRDVLAVQPDRPGAINNLGLVLMDQGKLEEAAATFRRALALKPDDTLTHGNLGLVLKEQGKLEEAAATFQRVLALKPDDAWAYGNLGNVLRMLGRLDEAAASYRQAIALRPDMALAYRNLGTVLCESGQVAESIALFRRHAELAYGTRENSGRGSEPTPPHKLQHDREQRDYLMGRKAPGGSAAAGDTLHLEEGGRMAGRAVNPDASHGEIAARWRSSKPQLVVIDNLLTDPALEELRRFCWGSTVWRSVYPGGYLGAMPEHGFACPLLAQIADELRSTYPAVLGEHPLLQFWGFKYDSRLNGIAVHADFAAVNVNFWITPDDANLEPESGGLVIWDVPAPLDWGFAKYNSDAAAARDFLAGAGANSVTVPYRANRAVIFDSDLFHETDRIAFKEGYLNRRINITMLYGRREAATQAIGSSGASSR
jgi:Flp pilus assembly protein TadD